MTLAKKASICCIVREFISIFSGGGELLSEAGRITTKKSLGNRQQQKNPQLENELRIIFLLKKFS